MIVRIAPRLSITLGRVDEEGEVVQLTPLEFDLKKLCPEEFQRVCAEVQAKQDEINRSLQAFLAAQKAEAEQALMEVSTARLEQEQVEAQESTPVELRVITNDEEGADDAGDTDDL